jgi:hypothetical protein
VAADVRLRTDDDVAPPKKNPAEIRVIDRVTHQIRRLITGGVNTYPAWPGLRLS